MTNNNDNGTVLNPPDEDPEEEVMDSPKEIDFQPVIDSFVASVGGSKGIVIYDLDNQKIVGEYNANEKFATASLYKLFVVYEGYRRLESGEWDGGEVAGSTGYTVAECLDLAIRESNSPCAETLWAKIGRSSLDNIVVSDYGITSTEVSKLTSTPSDIMSIMKLFYLHPHFSSNDLISTMKDSFLNQPVTTDDWRQGFPSGFSGTNVFNKVGWNYDPDSRKWTIYHDAAIVEFPEINRHFIVVVMTNYINPRQIAEFGQSIEKLVLEDR